MGRKRRTEEPTRGLSRREAVLLALFSTLYADGKFLAGRLFEWLTRVTAPPTITGTGAITLEPVIVSGCGTVTLTSVTRPTGHVELRKIEGPGGCGRLDLITG
jgi:hypothetical protein